MQPYITSSEHVIEIEEDRNPKSACSPTISDEEASRDSPLEAALASSKECLAGLKKCIEELRSGFMPDSERYLNDMEKVARNMCELIGMIINAKEEEAKSSSTQVFPFTSATSKQPTNKPVLCDACRIERAIGEDLRGEIIYQCTIRRLE
ncbi:hypothetical protein AAVH_07460 [Aphelenchoides avenae]|nr:hypothetical protein AAVH_07460 [Aphelenchus avenae]